MRNRSLVKIVKREEKMRENVLIIRHSKDDYFFGPVAENYNVKSTFCNKFEKKYFKLAMAYNICVPLFSFGWKHHVSEYNKIIIFDYGWSKEITDFIKKYNPTSQIHLFFFNTISNKQHQKILKDKNIDKIWSFDQGDVEKYGLNFNTPMYSKEYVKKILIMDSPQNDIVFVGKAKERSDLILNIEKSCKKKGIKTDFTIIENEKDYIAYSDYIHRVSNAKCILDITNKGQLGLTLRFMEALFFKKKIITNNKYVRNYDFYNNQNIFIIEDGNIDGIENFVHSNKQEIAKEQIEYYDLEKWIKRFV